MATLFSLFPTAEALLELAPDDLAPILLQLAKARRQAGNMFWPDSVPQVTVGSGMTSANEYGYPYHTKARVEALLNETWAYLSREATSCQRPTPTGATDGWC